MHAGLRDPVQQRLHDASGKEVVSPVEYETLGLLGTNCGLSDPDDLAQMNYIANDLGVDTIELGATIAVLMEAGLGTVRRREVHGRRAWPRSARARRRASSGRRAPRAWASTTSVKRVPGHQEAGDQRLRPARDRGDRHHHDGHRAGRRPHRRQPAAPQDARDGAAPRSWSRASRIRPAWPPTTRSGLCIFGMGVTNPNIEFIANAINAAHGTSLTQGLLRAARARGAQARVGVQQAGGVHGEGRRAAGVLLRGAAAADEPRRAVPRRRRSRHVRSCSELNTSMV